MLRAATRLRNDHARRKKVFRLLQRNLVCTLAYTVLLFCGKRKQYCKDIYVLLLVFDGDPIYAQKKRWLGIDLNIAESCCHNPPLLFKDGCPQWTQRRQKEE